MTTTETTATELTDEIFAQLDELFEKLDGQVLVSQSRWVDNLLDLYNIVELAPLQHVIEETLSEMRHLRSVKSSWLRHRLLMLAGAVEVEAAFDATAALML